METSRQLKINLLKEQHDYSRKIQKILAELLKVDEHASLLQFERAIASRTLIKKLWDILPDEQDSYYFSDVEEQTTHGRELLPEYDFTQSVTLHLGWDVLSFSCSLEAAWQSWKDFNYLNTDTFNCCIYPQDLEWYIIRAGRNLYPMNYTGERYVLIKNTKQPVK